MKMTCSGLREHAQLAGPAELERELAKDFVAEAVEGLDAGVVQPERCVEVDTLLHLRRGLLGEGDREDLVRLRRGGGDEMDDARGEDVGLAGARARDDEERPGTVLDRPALLVGEGGKDVRTRDSAQPELELLGHGVS